MVIDLENKEISVRSPKLFINSLYIKSFLLLVLFCAFLFVISCAIIPLILCCAVLLPLSIISTGVLIVGLSRIRGKHPLWNTAHNNSTHRLSWFLYLACQLYLVCQKWSPLSHVWKSYTSMKNCILGHFCFSSQFLQHDNLKNQTELQYKKHTIWLYVAVSTSATKRFLDVVKYYLQCLTDTYVACDKGYFAMTSLKHMRKRLFPGNKYRSKYCTPSPPMAAPLKSPSSRRIPSIRERARWGTWALRSMRLVLAAGKQSLQAVL